MTQVRSAALGVKVADEHSAGRESRGAASRVDESILTE